MSPSIDQEGNLDIDYMVESQGSGEVTYNQFVNVAGTLIQLVIQSLALTAPPGGETEGDRYVPASVATGVWAGLEGKIVTYRETLWQVDDLKAGFVAYIVAEARLKFWDGSVWHNIEAGGAVDHLQAYFVGKHGSDTNDGKSQGEAFLTFTAAAAAAAALTPSITNKFVIFCDDAGVYAESFTLGQWISVFAFGVTVEGLVTIGDDCSLRLNKIKHSLATQGVKHSSSGGRSMILLDEIECTGTGASCVRADGSGFLEVYARILRVPVGGVGLHCNSGNINAVVNEILLSGTGIGLKAETSSFMNAKINRIKDTGSSSFAGIFSTVTSDIIVNIEDLDCSGSTAYVVSSGSSLKGFIGVTSGTRTPTGTVSLQESLTPVNAGELQVWDATNKVRVMKRPSGFESWNFYAPTGRVGLNGTYPEASATNVFSVNAGGRVPKDFVSIVKASVRFIVQAGDPTNTVSVSYSHAAPDEPSTQHTGSGNPAYAVSAVGDIAEIDITSLLASLAADDSFSVECSPDAGATTLNFLTLDLEYIPNYDATQ